MTSTTKFREWLLQGVLLVVSLVVSLGIAEAVLRIKNSSGTNYDIEMWRYAKELKKRSDIESLGHEHVPSSHAVLQNIDFRTNEFGLRGGPVGPLQAGQRRILMLGGSITLGWGVGEKETVVARLQDMFRKDGLAVEVLNGGVGNYNAIRYVGLFLNRLTTLKPTDIVVHYFLRDAEALAGGGGNVLLRNSQLAVTLWEAINRYSARSGDDGLQAHYRAVYRPDSPGYREMVASFDRLKAHAEANGIRLYFAMQPDVHNLGNYPFHYIHEQMERVARERGFRYVDLLPLFLGRTPKDIWAMPGDPHPNAFGHKLMADAIYPVLKLN